MKSISGIEEMKQYLGKEIGVTDWFEITQERVNAFAEVTGDPQWIHVDVERARRETPFGGTIAHGYLTLSLASKFSREVYELEGVKMRINYGLNKVRFPAPVPVGSRIRMHLVLKELEEVQGGAKAVMLLTFEREGHDKPVCVAESIALWYV